MKDKEERERAEGVEDKGGGGQREKGEGGEEGGGQRGKGLSL